MKLELISKTCLVGFVLNGEKHNIEELSPKWQSYLVLAANSEVSISPLEHIIGIDVDKQDALYQYVNDKDLLEFKCNLFKCNLFKCNLLKAESYFRSNRVVRVNGITARLSDFDKSIWGLIDQGKVSVALAGTVKRLWTSSQTLYHSDVVMQCEEFVINRIASGILENSAICRTLADVEWAYYHLTDQTKIKSGYRITSIRRPIVGELWTELLCKAGHINIAINKDIGKVDRLVCIVQVEKDFKWPSFIKTGTWAFMDSTRVWLLSPEEPIWAGSYYTLPCEVLVVSKWFDLDWPEGVSIRDSKMRKS